MPDETPAKGNPGFLVLAVCGFLALAIVYLESAALRGAVGLAVADLAFVVPITLALAFCFIAYRRSQGFEARFWATATGLYAVLLASELYYLWWLLDSGGPPPPIHVPFQILHSVAAALFLFVLAAMTRLADAPGPARTRWFLDVGAVGAVVYVLCLKLFVQPLFAGLPNSEGAALVAAVYPAWGILMGVGVLWTTLRPGLGRWRLWERMIAVSMAIYAAGIIAWPMWFVAFQPGGSVDERSILDLILVLGHYLFMIAAAYRLTRPGQAWPMRQVGPERRIPSGAATYIAIGIAVVGLPALVSLAARAEPGSLDRGVYVVAAGAIAVLTVARTIATALENRRLFAASTLDPLTHIPGNRFFHERLASEFGAAQRFGEPICLLWLDVDDFARFNRLAGHAAGDEVLQCVATALREDAGSTEVACRVGGDEFAIIARGASGSQSLAIADRVRVVLRGAVDAGAPAVTLSVGIARYPEHGVDANDLVRMARGTAYWARLCGADRVLEYEPETVLGLDAEERIRAIEEQSRTGTVRALATAADARLAKSGSRSADVADVAVDLGRRLGLDSERIALLETAALLHDVGMIALGDDILSKPDQLTPEEIDRVRRHPQLGERIAGAAVPERAAKWIRHHHERWDGDGYPDGLRAAGIPLESRILAVCDAWASITSERPYRFARTAQEAAAELRACAATQFDPAIVEALVGPADEPGN
jgi:diguanylate cyclase (GGDEF)-like protein